MANLSAVNRRWLRAATVAGAVVFLFAIVTVGRSWNTLAVREENLPSIDPATGCGPVSLSLVGHWLGVRRSIGDLTYLTHSEDTGTSTLLDLKKAAESLGLAAEGVRLKTSSAIPWKFPMILHTKNHFVAVLPLDGDSLIVADPPEQPVVVKRSELADRWDGSTLVVARSRVDLDQALLQAHLDVTSEK